MASLKDKLQAAAVKIAECEQSLRAAKGEFDALFKQASANKARKGKQADPLSQMMENVSATNSDEQISELLRTEPNREWSYDDIALKLPSIPRSSVRVFLYKLQKEGLAVKIGRAKWRAGTMESLMNQKNLARG